MSNASDIDDITSPDKIEATGPIGQDNKKMGGGASQSFQSMMEQPGGGPGGPQGVQSTQSPFDLVHGQRIPQAGPTVDSLLSQINASKGTIDNVRSQLNTPDLKVRQASKYLLKNKLTDANAHLRSANNKLGTPEIAETPIKPGSSPIHKFLAYVADGQNQLEGAQTQLKELKEKGENLNPADLLLIQTRLNKAQTELEYSSVLLSKAIDSMKTIMNVQL